MNKRTLLSIFLFLLIFSSFGQTNSVIDSLENLIKDAKEDTTLVKRLGYLSNYYCDIADYDSAIYFADTALSLAKKLKYLKFEAQSLIIKGIAHYYKSDYLETTNNLLTAINICKEINYSKGLARANSWMGYVCKDQGNYQEARKHYLAGLQISEEISDTNGIRNAYTGLGLTYGLLGNYPEALQYHFAYLKIVEKLKDKYGMTVAYNNIGLIYDLQDSSAEAMKYYTKSLKLAEETGDKLGMARSYNNIGIIYDKNAVREEAIKYFSLSLKIKEEIGDRQGVASTTSNLGNLYLDMNDFREAEKKFKAALKIYEEIGSKEGIAMVYNHLGKLYTQIADYNKARKFIEEGLTMMLEVGNKDKLGNAYWALYKLDSAENNFSMALDHYKIYTIYTDSLKSEESTTRTAELKLMYETEKKDKEIELLNKDNEIKSLQLGRQKAVRHGMIAGIVLIFVTGYLLFRSFRLRKKLEQQQAIIGERKRISADLHDDVGSGLSRIMLLTELVKNEAKTPEALKEAEKIASISKELSANISEIIWALNANNDSLESLVAYIRRYAAEFFDESAVKLSIKSTGKISGIPINGELRREIFYTVKEALHNIYKHAQATEATLKFSTVNAVLTVAIQDNGIGLPEKDTGRYGNGLNNMQQRMADVGGSLNIENHHGTKITLEVPIR